MDLNRLSNGDKVIGISGIVLFILSFFKWLGYKSGPFSASQSAWSFTLLWLAVILGVLLVVYVVLKAMGTQLPELGAVSWTLIALGVAVLVFLLIVIKVITGPSVDVSGFGVDKTRKIGIYLGLVASIGLVVGAFMNAKEAGELPQQLGGKGGGSTPPPTA